MGKSAAETVREIEDTRERLDEELQELEHRLPPPARWAKRLAGLALGGGVAGSMFWLGVRKLRGRRKKKIGADRVQAVVQVVPDEWAERVSDALDEGGWRFWVGAIAALWLVLRLTELRQLRRMNRSLLVATPRQL